MHIYAKKNVKELNLLFRKLDVILISPLLFLLVFLYFFLINYLSKAHWFSKNPHIVRGFRIVSLCFLHAYGCQEKYKRTEFAFSKA